MSPFLQGITRPETKKEIMSICRLLDTELMLSFFQNIVGYQHFTKNEMCANTVPNIIVTPQCGVKVSAEDVECFSRSVGTNRGMHIVEDTNCNLEVIRDDKFPTLLKRLIELIPNGISSKTDQSKVEKSFTANIFGAIRVYS